MNETEKKQHVYQLDETVQECFFDEEPCDLKKLTNK